MATWGTAAALMLLPMFAMQVSDEMAWGAADFVIFGAMLIAVAGAFELAARMAGGHTYRAAVALALAGAFALVWINLAVGIIGSEENPANLMFGGVLAVGLTGAVVARFRPDGLARALVATALAQALVGAVALTAGFGSTAPSFPEAIMFLTLFFTALWLASAWLFRRAARERSPIGATP